MTPQNAAGAPGELCGERRSGHRRAPRRVLHQLIETGPRRGNRRCVPQGRPSSGAAAGINAHDGGGDGSTSVAAAFTIDQWSCLPLASFALLGAAPLTAETDGVNPLNSDSSNFPSALVSSLANCLAKSPFFCASVLLT